MSSEFGYSEIGTWLGDLPDGLVTSVGQLSDPDAEFGFVARAETAEVILLAPDGDGPLIIESTVTFPEDVLSAIRARPDRFFGEASAVLASAPGFHRLTDGEGDTAASGWFSAVVLRHHVHPDGASKHALLTGIVDLLTAASHLRNAGNRLIDPAGGA
jgi:hypothetical protein